MKTVIDIPVINILLLDFLKINNDIFNQKKSGINIINKFY